MAYISRKDNTLLNEVLGEFYIKTVKQGCSDLISGLVDELGGGVVFGFLGGLVTNSQSIAVHFIYCRQTPYFHAFIMSSEKMAISEQCLLTFTSRISKSGHQDTLRLLVPQGITPAIKVMLSDTRDSSVIVLHLVLCESVKKAVS